MTAGIFEVRLCGSCGLRYPLMRGHQFGTRCPHCLGETNAIREGKISDESIADRTGAIEKRAGLSVLIDNVRSAWNVGSILRTGDGFGFNHAYLCGITPTPEEEAVRKTSLGAEDFVTWSYHKDAVRVVKGLRKEGLSMFALEADKRALPIDQISRQGRDAVLIVGNEMSGIDPELLDLADKILYIPMEGGKRSFNAAIAFSVAAWILAREQA